MAHDQYPGIHQRYPIELQLRLLLPGEGYRLFVWEALGHDCAERRHQLQVCWVS